MPIHGHRCQMKMLGVPLCHLYIGGRISRSAWSLRFLRWAGSQQALAFPFSASLRAGVVAVLTARPSLQPQHIPYSSFK